MGLDEGDDASAGIEPLGGRGQGEALGCPAEVDDDEIDGGGGLEVQGVGAFVDGDAVVLAELPRQFTVGGVDAVDLGRAVLEQAVGESAGGAAEVGAGEAGRVEAELGQGVVEFEPAA